MTRPQGLDIQIVPSLLSANLAHLENEVRRVVDAGASWVSVDVMDGAFVPNLSFGPDHVRMVKKLGVPKVDAHLMVQNPEKAAPWFVEAGADIVTIHLEADTANTRKILKNIRKSGAKAGLAIKPKTSVKELLAYLDEIDLALVMTVEPGFGGASFLKDMLPKVETLRREINNRGLDCWLQVDGGINVSTIGLAASAGADSLVAGSAVFGAPDSAQAFKRLRELALESVKATKV